jgi:hypothetical protein
MTDDKLEKTRQWQKLEEARGEAEEIASGSRGSFPFDDRGKRDLLARLEAGARDVDSLIAAGALHLSEAGLVKADLERLTRIVLGFRPREMEHHTCYRAVILDPFGTALARLTVQTPLLEQAVEAQALHPEVLRKLLTLVEADLASLAKGEAKADAKKLAAAKELGARAALALAKLRERL